MKIYTLISPDRLSQGMFVDFYKKSNSDKTVVVIEISSLFSEEKQAKLITDASDFAKSLGKENLVEIMVKYRIKPKNAAPINKGVVEISDYIIKFDLYSTHMEVIKEPETGSLTNLKSSWEAHMNRLNN